MSGVRFTSLIAVNRATPAEFRRLLISVLYLAVADFLIGSRFNMGSA